MEHHGDANSDHSQKICSSLIIPIIRFFYHVNLVVQDVTNGEPMQTDITADIRELQPDVIVECYLEAKYYHYDPADIYELVDFNVSAENLVESDDFVTVQNIEIDEYSAAASLNDNFQELGKACPEWDKETTAIHPKWLEHHQSGHLTKDPSCPVCMEEAESKVNHRCRKGDRNPGIMHCDLAAFEASADGHKYCLVAAVTI